MKKGFAIINILIIVGIIIFSFLVYSKYFKSTDNYASNEKNIIPEQPIEPITQKDTVIEKTTVDKNNSPDTISNTIVEQKEVAEPQTPTPEPRETEQAEQNQNPEGFYENNKYNYSIEYPDYWPLRVRSDENISVGTVPPKDGQGAITIEISNTSANSEINKAKTEAKKYPGIINIEENPITLSGVTGTELVIKNLILNTADYYILLKNNGNNFVIKYSNESQQFVNDVGNSLNTFKFLK